MLMKTRDIRSTRSAFKALFCSLSRLAPRLVPFPIPRTRLGRRRLAVSYVGIALLVPVLSWITGSVSPLVVLAPVLVILVLALGLSVDLITDRPTSALDERERRIRDSALSRPLELGIVLGVVIGLLGTWTVGSDDPLPIAALTATSMLAVSARLLAIAWALPDSVGEE